MGVRLIDVPELSPSQFTAENMIRRHHATPCYLNIATGRPVIERPWRLVGWCNNVDESLMHNREGQLCLMLFHPEEGEWWQHYAVIDDEDRRQLRFDAKGGES